MFKKMDRLVGPGMSIVLHFALIFCAYKFIRFVVDDKGKKVEVMVMEVEEVNLEEFKEELEQIEELEDIQNEVVTDTPVETDTPDVQEETQDTDDFSNLDVMNDFSSPVVLKGLYGGRSAAGRARALSAYGGKYKGKTEDAVVKGLKWLKKNQRQDGAWGEEKSLGITSLALLTYLAHGENPNSREYGETVKKSIQYILAQQKMDGGFSTTPKIKTYGHSIATYAISEAYALTRIPALKVAMDKGVNIIVNGIRTLKIKKEGTRTKIKTLDNISDDLVTAGSYDYGYGQGERWDTSVAGWNAQALKAAKMAGCKNPKLNQTLDILANGFKYSQAENGKFKYNVTTSKDSGSIQMTGISVLCLQLLGHEKTPEVKKGLLVLDEYFVDPKKQHHSFFYRHYYITQAKFHAGGSTWKKWNNEFAPTFIKMQREDGSWPAPFNPEKEGGHGDENRYGPAYPTCMAALTLMVYYRNLPTFKKSAIEKIKEEKVEDDDIELEFGSIHENAEWQSVAL